MVGKIATKLNRSIIKKASYLHRTAQPPTLAAFRPWRIQ